MCVLRVYGKEPSKIQELTPVQEFITPKIFIAALYQVQ